MTGEWEMLGKGLEVLEPYSLVTPRLNTAQ